MMALTSTQNCHSALDVAHRTRAPNVARQMPPAPQIDTYALVALDAQIAGYVL
jgi:hypothetical protein